MTAFYFRRRVAARRRLRRPVVLSSAITDPVERMVRPSFVRRDPPGQVYIGTPDFSNASVTYAPLRTVTARVPRTSDTLARVIAEMMDHHVIRRLPEKVKVNVTPFLLSKAGRAVLIADCRAVNRGFGLAPGHRMWPTPKSCVRFLRRSEYMMSLDLHRCFDSIVLPASMRSLFRFGIREGPLEVSYFAYDRIDRKSVV